MELHRPILSPRFTEPMEDESTTVFGTIPMPRYGTNRARGGGGPRRPARRGGARDGDNRDAAAVAVVKALRGGHLDIDALVPFLQEGQAA